MALKSAMQINAAILVHPMTDVVIVLQQLLNQQVYLHPVW